MVLVTGGTGLVGAHLLYKLAYEGEKIKAIYRTKHKIDAVKNVFSHYTDNYQNLFDRIEWVKVDILDTPTLDKALKGIDYVYHCAAFVSFEPDKYQLLRRTNIEGTANIVNLCISNNVKKLCYVSSVAATGSAINNTPINESTIWNPEEDHNVYAISKYGAEMEVWRGIQEGLGAIIVNPGVILGTGFWKYGSGSLFKTIYKGHKYYTSGSIPLIAVKDVVNIMVTLLKSDIKNERYILVSENWTLKSFLQNTAKALGVKPPYKLAKPWLLQIFWRLDWLKHKLTGKRRRLSKHMVKSLIKTSDYDSNKIKQTLNYKFEPIDDVIVKVANSYLKQVQ